MSGDKCGRTARRTGKPCRNPAGFKTVHPQHGACFLHGGGSKEKPSGGRPGNTNALLHGAYAALYASAFTREERDLYERIEINPRVQAENNLRLICIRIHRVLIRQARIEAAADEDGMATTSVQYTQGWQPKGSADYAVTERASITDTMLRFEQALTALQALKDKAIDSLRKALKEGGTSENRLDNLVHAIYDSARFYAEEEEARAT